MTIFGHFRGMTVPISMLIKKVCLVYLLFFIPHMFGQGNTQVTLGDTLATKSYEDLNTLSAQAYADSNNEQLKVYREYHLKKAKRENNTLEMARAYYNFIGWEDFENDITYCDSIIDITQNSTHRAYPTNGYLIKANLYYNNSEFSKALDNYIIASEFAEQKGYRPLQIEAMQGIAAIKNVWGLHDEALEIYRANYNNLINIPDYQSTYYEDYIVLANNLSLSYIRNHIPDSALMVSEQAMKVTALSKDTLNYIDLVKVQATANYYLKNYPRAMDSLMRFLPEFTDLTLSDSYYMIGKMYQYYGNDQLVITYFKKIDSLHRIINDPYPELQEVYHTLFKHASSLNDMEQQGYYIDKLIEVDSILDHKYAKIGHKMRTGYDIPKLKKEKQQLNQKLNNKQTTIAITLITIGLLTLIMVYYYKRQRIYKKRLHNLLEQETTVTTRTKTDRKQKTDTLDLSPTIIEDVLKKIEQFEASKSYVSKDITLHTLAKEFNTNSTYLSNIVNHEKQSNFSTYLKDLRITNAINTIKSNKEYLKFSISGLADEFGFNTAESFSKAFWEKTGIKPSYFLDEMRRNIRGRDL